MIKIDNVTDNKSFRREWLRRRLFSTLVYTFILLALLAPIIVPTIRKNPLGGTIGLVIGFIVAYLQIFLNFHYAVKRLQQKSVVEEVSVSEGKVIIRTISDEGDREDVFTFDQTEYKPKYLYGMYLLFRVEGDFLLKKEANVLTVPFLLFDTRQLSEEIKKV